MKDYLKKTIFTIQPDPVVVTAEDIAGDLSGGDASDQAAVLLAWAEDVSNAHASWADQCHRITEKMTDQQRHHVASILATLIEQLLAIPAGRAKCNDDEPPSRGNAITMADAEEQAAAFLEELYDRSRRTE